MTQYRKTSYGQQVAKIYDQLHPGVLETDACVATLAQMAEAGPALELGVGTGRIAIPLAASGVAVDGIDCSPSMLEQLRANDLEAHVGSFEGDFAELALERRYQLIYIVADTFFMLIDQQQQIECIRRVAAHLTTDGTFVLEAFVPNKARALTDAGLVVRKVTADSVVLGVSVHDPVGQIIDGQQILITTSGTTMAPGRLRYVWPSELDLMAALGGLALVHRWGDWHRQPFTQASARHVSVYRATEEKEGPR